MQTRENKDSKTIICRIMHTDYNYTLKTNVIKLYM